jgi:RNA polymerase sigma-70 factor (ECF subfamily)
LTAINPVRERFLALFHENKNRVYDFALRTLNDKDAAEDVTQEAFIRLFNTLKKNSSINNGRNWLFIATRNLCYNYLRDHRKEVAIDSIENSESVIATPVRHEHLRLQKALNTMDGNYREALILKEYQGLSYYEISQVLSTTVPAVRAILYKARLQLKQNYEKIKTAR